MNHLAAEFGTILLMLACIASIFTFAAALVFAAHMRRPISQAKGNSPVTLLKPLHCDPETIHSHLASFVAQKYEGPVQIVCGVHSDSDPALNSVAGLHAEERIELVIDSQLHGANRKISNLINIYPHSDHDILVLTDSDIVVSSDWLSAVVGALQEPGVGAVSCLYRGRPGSGLWSKIAAMGISYQFLPNATFGIFFDIVRPCFGSTIAIHRNALDRIGGFHAFADCLADDYEIGRSVGALGYKITVPPITVEHVCTEKDALELFHHELRWNRTIRNLHKAGHFATLITQPIPLALAALALLGFHALPLAVLTVALASRLFMKWCIDATTGSCAGPALLLPVRDVIHFCVFAASLFGRSVLWRGTRFHIAANGQLRPA